MNRYQNAPRTRAHHLARVILLQGLALLTVGCAEREENSRPAMERAQDKLEESMREAEARLAEGKAEARKALATAMERWEDLRPEAEQAVASIEERVEKLLQDSEALKRLPPDALAKARAQLDELRAKLAQAKADHEKGDTDLAVEKVDDVQKQTAAVEELLVENPDPPGSGKSPGR